MRSNLNNDIGFVKDKNRTCVGKFSFLIIVIKIKNKKLYWKNYLKLFREPNKDYMFLEILQLFKKVCIMKHGIN